MSVFCSLEGGPRRCCRSQFPAGPAGQQVSVVPLPLQLTGRGGVKALGSLVCVSGSMVQQTLVSSAPPGSLQGFEMRTYGGLAFAHLRHFLGLSEKEYQLSLSSQSSYLQFISNSKSKADFFLT